jgi:hypothetical protein
MKQLMAILVVGGLAAIMVWGSYPSANPQAAQAAPKISPAVEAKIRAELAREELVNNVTLTKTAWKKGGFGTVMVATFKFHNANDVAVKDIEVTCNQFGPSGTLISTTARTIYRALPPKTDTSIQDFSMGFIHTQSATAGCKVTNIG